MRSLFQDFFRPGSTIEVDARGPELAQAEGLGRRVNAFIERLGVPVVMAGSVLSAGAMMMMVQDADGAPQPRASAVASVQVSQHAARPSADELLTLHAKNCLVTINLSDKPLSNDYQPRDSERLKATVLLQERARCEGFEHLWANALLPGKDTAGQVFAYLDANRPTWRQLTQPIGGKGAQKVESLLLERHADAKALLQVARDELSQARTPAQITQALGRFDAQADDLVGLRAFKTQAVRGTEGTFDERDTAGVTRKVRDLVHAAATPTALPRALASVLSERGIDDTAWKLSLGSVVAQQAQISQQLAALSAPALAARIDDARARLAGVQQRSESLDAIHGEAEDVLKLHQTLQQAQEQQLRLAGKLPTAQVPGDAAVFASKARSLYDAPAAAALNMLSAPAPAPGRFVMTSLGLGQAAAASHTSPRPR